MLEQRHRFVVLAHVGHDPGVIELASILGQAIVQYPFGPFAIKPHRHLEEACRFSNPEGWLAPPAGGLAEGEVGVPDDVAGSAEAPGRVVGEPAAGESGAVPEAGSSHPRALLANVRKQRAQG